LRKTLGYINIPEGLLIQPGEMKKLSAGKSLRDDQRGHRASPMSAAVAGWRSTITSMPRFEKGDTVVLLVAHHSGQREGDLSYGRSPVSAAKPM